MLREFYRNKKVFLTGHTGFKGSWLSIWLTKLGAKVCGYSLAPSTNPSMFYSLNLDSYIHKSVIADILDESTLNSTLIDFKPDIVFHMAAQPLVRLSYAEPILTYKTNVIGTLNVLEASRRCPTIKSFVNVTTDKCYENVETQKAYVETDLLGGYDMYSSSKACSEILSSSYRKSFLTDSFALATARAGNVIGGGDWAKERLVPDLIRAFEDSNVVELRNPNSIRPWQHVLEPLSGYLLLGKLLFENGAEFAQAFNFGPTNNSNYTVLELAEKVRSYYSNSEIFCKNENFLHEANLLKLNIDKVKTLLGWQPALSCDEAIRDTVIWYQYFYAKQIDMLKYSIKQIDEYEGKINWKKVY